MQHLRLTVRPPVEAAPEAFRLLAASEHVAEARGVSLNLSDSRGATVLLAVNGDAAAVREGLDEAPEVFAADVAPGRGRWFHLLAVLQPESVPLMRTVFRTMTRDGLVVLTPVVYRDAAVQARLVGEPAAVGDAVEALPAPVEIEVHEVGERGLSAEPAAALSDRQREAVLAALELGYYDRPREATHEDVAAELGCAPSTASEHLQKAEAKLVRAAMEPRR